MASVTVIGGRLDLRDPFFLGALLDADPFGSQSSTQFAVQNQALGLMWTFSGQNFSNFVDGVPAAGTVTAVTVASPQGVFSVTNVSLSMPQLLLFLATNDVDGLNAAVFGGPDTIVAAAGDDVIYGLGGDDTIQSGDGFDTVYGGAGADTITDLSGGSMIYGGAGADVLTGGDGSDSLWGDEGNDTLSGGLGNDRLDGGTGDDFLSGGDGDDELTSLDGIETIDGGAGNDFLLFSRASTSVGIALLASDLSTAQGATLNDGSVIRNVERVDITLSTGNDIVDLTGFVFESSRFDGGDGTDLLVADWRVTPSPLSLTLLNFEQYFIHFGSGNDDFTGGSGADFLDGGEGSDTLNGQFGDDDLRGGDGDDTLDGGAGNDLVDGGAGDDFIYLSGGVDDLNGGLGNDLIYIGAGQPGVLDLAGMDTETGATLANGTVLRNFERFTYLSGAGDDTLRPGSAYGYWDGGEGFDTLIADFSGETRSVELSDFLGGRLFVGSLDPYSNDFLHFVNVERTEITGGSADDFLTGLAGVDILRGGAGNDSLRGGLGDDVLEGGDGNDYIDGGAGRDILSGGDGDDYIIADAGDEVDGGAGQDIVSLDLSSSSEAISLNLQQLGSDTWTEFADGTRVRNVEGVSLLAGSGDDTLIIDAPLVGGNLFYGGDGYDRLTIDMGANAAQPISWQFDRFIFGSSANFLLVQVDEMRLIGSDSDDVLRGLNDADQVFGRGGADTLSGRGFLDGGDGDDLIVAEGNAFGGAGNDTIYGSFNSNVLEGGAGDDVLFGRPQFGPNGPDADWLIGGDGDDRLYGVGGTNVLVGGEGDDIATFFDAHSNDTLWIDMEAGVVVIPDDTSPTWTVLYDSIEGIEGSLASSNTIFGDAGDNLLIGGTFADTLIGRAGDDELRGGFGDDWLVGGDGDDILQGGGNVNVLNGGEGLDLASYADKWGGVWVDLAAGVYSSGFDWDVFISIEGILGSAYDDNLFGSAAGDVLLGAGGDDSLIGLDGDDVLEGGAGNDWIVGGNGADRLVGGAGVDVLTGGAGADVFVLGLDAGWDVAFDFDPLEDFFDLGGLQWLGFLEFDADGDGTLDTLLGFAGGNFVALGVSGLTLDEWNALVV
jgi:Ca2+-binding RTX toxin-like protein